MHHFNKIWLFKEFIFSNYAVIYHFYHVLIISTVNWFAWFSSKQFYFLLVFHIVFVFFV